MATLTTELVAMNPIWRTAILVGFFGAFTTFSALTYETLELARSDEIWRGQLLRIFIGESDRWQGKLLYEAIVELVRQSGLAGATVLRGLEGFGAHSRVHTAKILRLSEDLPIVVEIVDTAEKIQAILPVLDEMVSEGLVTLERVQVIAYRHGGAAAGSAGPEAGEKR